MDLNNQNDRQIGIITEERELEHLENSPIKTESNQMDEDAPFSQSAELRSSEYDVENEESAE